MTAIEVSAFAKVNLCLLLGGPRRDGRHELVTLLESVQLADDVRLVVPAPSGGDEVFCPGVDGPNLVGDALTGLRAAGWAAPPVRVEIEKRIPVAAGMGGGSADAGAVLRSASQLAPVSPSLVLDIAGRLGSDVPSQLDPGPVLGVGAGDVVTPLAALAEHAVLVVPQPFGLSTADVYREADRLGLVRGDDELLTARSEFESLFAEAGARLRAQLLVNDLEPAAVSLRPEVGEALDAIREVGADDALVCGSGPTAIGLFWGSGALDYALSARDRLLGRWPGAVAVAPVLRGVGVPMANP
jgi:4-diphosphocytidyl-2-C-methyl-D-erythritol kinase